MSEVSSTSRHRLLRYCALSVVAFIAASSLLSRPVTWRSTSSSLLPFATALPDHGQLPWQIDNHRQPEPSAAMGPTPSGKVSVLCFALPSSLPADESWDLTQSAVGYFVNWGIVSLHVSA